MYAFIMCTLSAMVRKYGADFQSDKSEHPGQTFQLVNIPSRPPFTPFLVRQQLPCKLLVLEAPAGPPQEYINVMSSSRKFFVG